jgi:excinuclease UvrABC nuclease subunit
MESRKCFTWTRDQLNRATSPLVYIFRDRQGKPLYIGSSYHGIDRPLGRVHHRSDVRESCHEIEFICCSSEADANTLERRLIYELKPKYNRTVVKKTVSIRATRRVSRDVNLSLIRKIIERHQKTKP